MGFWNAVGTGLADLVTFGGYSKEREREKQEELNKLQMQREDNAYQRTVEDMNKAGLNPLSMSGTNAAQPLTNPIKSENNTFDKAMQLGTTISSVATGLAQAKNLNASTVGMGIANAMAQKDLDYLNRIGLSPLQKTHQNQKELANIGKGIWGRLGNDIYDNVGEKINELIEKGTNIINEGIESLGKGEFNDAINKTADNAAEKVVEKTGMVGKVIKKYGETKRNVDIKLLSDKVKYYNQEIERYSKSPTTENLKRINELKKERDSAVEELKKAYGSSWRQNLKGWK